MTIAVVILAVFGAAWLIVFLTLVYMDHRCFKCKKLQWERYGLLHLCQPCFEDLMKPFRDAAASSCDPDYCESECKS